MGWSMVSSRGLKASLGAVAMLGIAAPAWAQSAGDYRDFKLPAKPTQAAPVAGPNDSDAPPPRAPAPAPSPAPSASAPTVVLPPPPSANRAPAQARPAPTARPTTAAPSAAPPVPAPSAAPDAGSALQVPTAPSPVPSLSETLPTTVAPAPTAAPEPASNWWLWPLLAALGVLAGGIAWAMLKRRNGASGAGEVRFVRPQVPAEAEPVEPAAADLQPAPVAPVVPVAAAGLTVALEVTKMSASLVNATLSYRLVLTNGGATAIESLAVSGDMISAHASVPQEQLIDASDAPMPVLHQLASLAPGESATLSGDIRLPLAAITPIQHGSARLFVPLARFRTGGFAGDRAVAVHSAFLVGQEPQSRAKLQPFRLDLGPRLYSQVGQRPIVLAA